MQWNIIISFVKKFKDWRSLQKDFKFFKYFFSKISHTFPLRRCTIKNWFKSEQSAISKYRIKETDRKLKNREDRKPVMINFRILDTGSWVDRVKTWPGFEARPEAPCQCATWGSWGLTMGRLVCASSGTRKDESRPRSSILKVHTSGERGHERYRREYNVD